MSRPIQPSGSVAPIWRTSPPAAGSPILPPGPEGGDVATGRWIGGAGVEQLAGTCRPGPPRAGTTPIGWPCAARNVKHMPPPMMRLSTTSSRASITPSLSRHLGPAEDGDERPARVRRGSPSSTSTSFASSRPAALGQVRRRADDRGVGPVRRAEGVVDVGVLALDQPADEGRVVRRLARVEAQVLEQLDARAPARPGGPAPGPSSTSGRARPWAGRGGCRR